MAWRPSALKEPDTFCLSKAVNFIFYAILKDRYMSHSFKCQFLASSSMLIRVPKGLMKK